MKLSDMIPAVDVPEGKKGLFAIERFTVSEDAARLDQFMNAMHGLRVGVRTALSVSAGTYTRLVRDGQRGRTVVMSDTRSEKLDHLEFVKKATGRVFLAGLGIGMSLQAVLLKKDVSHVTVLELEQDVIDLVGPHYQARFGSRLTIEQGDVLGWRPPKGTHLRPFDAAWFDVWDTKSDENLPQYTALKRRWARWAKWRGLWAEDTIREVVRAGRWWR